MPGYKTHIRSAWFVCAMITALTAVYVAPPHLYLFGIFLIGMTTGTLFPDIDITSIGQKTFFTMTAILIAASILCKAPFVGAALGFVACIPILSTHRGPFHHPLVITLLVITGLYTLIKAAPRYSGVIVVSGISFWLGAMLHLLLDKHVTAKRKRRWRR